MGKTGSMKNQIQHIARDHIGFGDSKREDRTENMSKGADYNEATRDKFYSTKTYHDFIKANTKMMNEIKAEFGVKRLDEVEPEHFTRYWESHKDNWSPKTQATYRDHYLRLNDYIQDKGWGDGFITPSNYPEIPRGWKSNYNRTDRAKAFDDKSTHDLKDFMPEYRNVIDFLSHSGARAEGTKGIKWKDVDESTIRLNEKGGKPRNVPMDRELRGLLGRLRSERNPHPNDKIFGDINTTDLRKAIRNYNKDNNLPGRSLHSFRHYYAGKQYFRQYIKNRMKGMDPRVSQKEARREVSKLLGHGQPEQAQAKQGRISVTYSYVSGKEGEAIANKAEALLTSLDVVTLIELTD